MKTPGAPRSFTSLSIRRTSQPGATPPPQRSGRRFDPALALDKYEGLMRDLVGASTNTRAKATAGP